jgi:hypothetical protein
MNWVRANIRSGARLALFALVVQFALSFGHFHGIEPPQTVIAQAASAIGPAQPDSDHHSGDAADLCAVCAVMAMAGTMLDASPPALPQQQAHSFAYRLAETGVADPNPAPGAFQPRGPPLS